MEDGGNFSDDEKGVADISAVVAGLYALSNVDECAEVADRMAKAATIQKDYDRRIASLRRQVGALQAQIIREKGGLQQRDRAI